MFRSKCVVGCLLCAVLLAGCTLSPRQSSPEIPPSTIAVENLDASDLMQAYGALLRARVREDDHSYIENNQFKRLQQEVAKRNLVTKKTSEQIAQGIVYLGMPKEQLMASIDNLEISEQENFDRFLLKLYRGDDRGRIRIPIQTAIFAPYMFLNPWALTRPDHKKGNEIVLTCTDENQLKENVIGLYVWGRTTFETYSGVTISKSHVRTNFAPGFFDRDSTESQRYIKAGHSVPGGPKWERRDAGGRSVFMSKLKKGISSASLKGLVDEATNSSGRYPQLLRYLEKTC